MDVTTDPQPKCMQSDASESVGGKGSTQSTRRRKWRKTFIRAFRTHGNMSRACLLAGVERTTVYKARRGSRRFNEAYLAAQKNARLAKVDAFEDALYSRALGWEEDVYKDGKLIGRRRKHSDALLVRGLEAEAPRKYAKRTESRSVSSSHVLVTVESRTRMLTDPGYADLICQLDAITAQPIALASPSHEGIASSVDVEPA